MTTEPSLQDWPKWHPSPEYSIDKWAAGNESGDPFDADAVCAVAESWLVMEAAIKRWRDTAMASGEFDYDELHSLCGRLDVLRWNDD